MIRIGLEKEFFTINTAGEVVVTPNMLPQDGCGWLAEARGKPKTDVVEAVYSLLADCKRLEQTVSSFNKGGSPRIALSDAPLMIVPKTVRIAAQRKHAKDKIKYQNFYGFESHRNAQNEATAGVHISFSNGCSAVVDGKSYDYNGNFDWPAIFMALDKAFKEEIKAAKRNPGFYEMKMDGRVEYRSLPSNVSMDKVLEVVSALNLY